MRALLILELKFAALRDKLFIERMEEAAAEEQMLLDGMSCSLSATTDSDRRADLQARILLCSTCTRPWRNNGYTKSRRGGTKRP